MPRAETCFALSFVRVSQIYFQRKWRLAFEKSQAVLRNRETTVSCLAIASSTHLFTIIHLMGVALSSDLFLCAPYCELYSLLICWIIDKQIDLINIVKFYMKINTI